MICTETNLICGLLRIVLKLENHSGNMLYCGQSYLGFERVRCA